MTNVYDAVVKKVVEKGQLYLVYGKEPNTTKIPAVEIQIAKDDNDPRELEFVGYNGFNVNIPVGKPVVVPVFIYETLKEGNLKDRVSKI